MPAEQAEHLVFSPGWDTPGFSHGEESRAWATAFTTPLVRSLILGKGQSGGGTSPKTMRIGAGYRAEPSVVMPLSPRPRSSQAVFQRLRNASMSVWGAAWSSTSDSTRLSCRLSTADRTPEGPS